MGARTVHAIIEGRVQGVGFRWWTEREAKRLGLIGWVRNRTDGSVEAVFAGPDEAVTEMLRACHAGPGPARVDAVTARDMDADQSLSGFSSRPTV